MSQRRVNKQTRRLSFEQLEARRLLARDILYIDFDSTAGGPNPPGNLQSTYYDLFKPAHWQGKGLSSPDFLDVARTDASGRTRVIGDVDRDGTWDGDGKLNQSDARVVRSKTVQYVKKLFKGFDVEVVSGRNGWGRLQAARNNDDVNLYVMFVGGDYKNDSGSRSFGRAYQAPIGENNEWFGWVYAGNIADSMIGDRLFHNDDGRDLAWNIAVSTAHEFGHMLGLGHPSAPSSVFSDPNDVKVYCDEDGRCRIRQNGPFEIIDPFLSVMSSGSKLRGTSFAKFDYSGWRYPIETEALRRNYNNLTKELIDQSQRAELRRSFTDFQDFINSGDIGGYSHDSAEVDLTFSSQTPSFPVLPAVGNAAGSVTASTISTQLRDGLTQYRNQAVASLATTLNLPSDELVLASGAIADATGLTSRLQSLIDDVAELASANSMTSVRQSLEAAGYSIDYLITDGELAALDRTKPSNYVQVSRTFTLLNSKASTSLRTDELAALQFLKDVVGFSGNLEIEANAAIHVSMGIDSNGFYFSPGRLLESQFTLQGDVTGNIGNFGWVSGDATAMLAPILEIHANTADGKLRLADVGSNSRMVKSLSYDGFASLEANAEVSVFDSNLLEFTGNWKWDLDETGFTYDSELSGFDTESLRESILDLAAQGLDEVVSQASQLATITKNIPLVGDSIQSPFTDLIESAFAFDISETTLADYLSERGITVRSEITVSDIFDGTFRNKSIVQFDFNRREELPNAVSVAGTKAFAFNALGAPIEFQFQGNLSAAPYIDFNVGIGLDASQGPYIVEGTGLTAALPVTGNVTGKAKIGSLVDIVAKADVSLPASLAFAFDDGDTTPNERLYLFSSFSLSDAALPPSNTTLSGVIQLNDLSLTAQTPASNIPVIGRFLDSAFSWRAVGSYDLTTRMGSFVVDQNSLPSFSSIRDDLFRTVAGNLVDANPIPSDVGKVLGTPIAFLGNKTVADLIGMGGADLFLNPDGYKNQSADDAPKGDGITLNYDFAKPANIIAMLSGRDADYFSVTIDKTFSQSTEINVLPPTLLYSFFGLVNFSGRIDVIPKMSAMVSVQVGLDSRGFYVADRPGGVLTLAGSIEARPALTGSLTIVPLAEVAGIVGIGARGVVDVVSPTGASKVRFNEIVSNGNLVTSNFDLSLELFMNIGLEGKVGILGSGLEAAGRVDKEFTLFTYPGDSKQPGQDVFGKLKKDMENKGKAMFCVGGFAVGGVFGGVVACGIAYGQEILDAIDDGARWVGDRFNETVEGAKKIAGQVTSTAKKAVEDAVDTAKEWRNKVANEVEKLPGGKEVLDFLDKLDDPVQSFFENNSIDVGWFGGKEFERPKSIANELSYIASIDTTSKTLTITPKSHSPLNLVITIIEDQLVVDGDDFQRSVYTREKRKRTYDAFGIPKGHTDWKDAGNPQLVTFSNLTRVPRDFKLVIEGTELDDRFVTTDTGRGLPSSQIVMTGKGGDDLLIGGSGDDMLTGGEGSDRLIGNGGNDLLQGGSQRDFLYGGQGSDTIDGGSGNDLVDDAEGNVASNEVNRLIGGPGEDQINGGPNRDLIEGGDDKDVIRGNGGNDEIYGGTGFISGFPDTDNTGDFLDGGDGDDILDGGRGDDNLVGGANEDTLRGGAGNDVLYSHTLEDREGGNSKGTLDGGAGQDVIYGGAGIDKIVGGADADLIFGGGSGDTIYADNDGGAESSTDGNDIVFSGEGNDLVYLSGGGPALTRFVKSEESEFRNYVAADAGIDTVYGGSGPDFIDVGAGDDEAFAGGGEDVLVGVSGRDRLNGDAGNDKLFAGSPESRNLGGILQGGSNNDELYGDSGDDELYGESGNDLLVTKTGENIAEGGSGDDDFIFGFGVDILRGDSDLDEFFLDNPTGTLALSAGEIQIFGGGQIGDTVYFRGGGNQEMRQTISMSPDKTLGKSKAQIPEGIQIVNFAGVGQLFDYSEAKKLDYFTTNGSDQVSLDNGELGADQFAAINTNDFARYEFSNKTDVCINGGLDQTDIADTIEVLPHSDMFGASRVRVLTHSGDDMFFIKATNSGVDYEFFGQSGNDQFSVSDSPVEVPGSTAHILGNVSIDSGEGAQNVLLIDDRLGAAHSVLLTHSTIAGIAPVMIRYAGVGFFNRPNSSGLVLKLSHDDDDTIYVDSTRLGNSHLIEGFGGNDEAFVGVASPNDNLGDLDSISGYIYFDGGSSDGDRLFAKDDEISQDFDYRLDPSELRHLPNRMNPTRLFAGIGFGNIESARLDASQGRNRLSVRPSPTTSFDVDGNAPTSEDCTPGGGDHLALDLKPVPPADASTVEEPSVTFTLIVDGRQEAGIWNFGSPHQPVNFESIESFNLLDKLAISSDAEWSGSAGVRVISTVLNRSYSDIVTNFTVDDLVPFVLPEFTTYSVLAFGVRNNRLLAADVNNDSTVSPIDALLVINHLNKRPSGTVGSSVGFVDVNADGIVSPLDALLVINFLNREARPAVTFGGVRTAVADLNSDGVDEIIAVSGANHLPTLIVFNGITGALIASPQPLKESTGNFGTNVIAGDIDGDGKVEIITSSDRGVGEYTIWRWENGAVTKIADRAVVFSPGYLGGVRVATGDLNGDGKSEIIVGSGTGTDASVRAYDASGVQLSSFLLAKTFGRGGVYVATGDYNGDGRSDLFVSSGRRGNSQIQVFDGLASLGNSIASSRLISNAYSGQDAISPISIALKDSDGDEEKELYSSQLSDGRSDQLKKWEFSEAADAFFSTLQSDLDPDWTSGAYLG